MGLEIEALCSCGERWRRTNVVASLVSRGEGCQHPNGVLLGTYCPYETLVHVQEALVRTFGAMTRERWPTYLGLRPGGAAPALLPFPKTEVLASELRDIAAKCEETLVPGVLVDGDPLGLYDLAISDLAPLVLGDDEHWQLSIRAAPGREGLEVRFVGQESVWRARVIEFREHEVSVDGESVRLLKPMPRPFRRAEAVAVNLAAVHPSVVEALHRVCIAASDVRTAISVS